MAKDHYISQFYLRRFWFENKFNPKQIDIYTYFLDKDICKQKGIENVAYKVDLFSKEIESWFSIYEWRFNKLIWKIENNIKIMQNDWKIENQINQEDKLLLAKLIDFQFRRATIANPIIKNHIESKNNELIAYVKELSVQNFSIPEFEKYLKSNIFKQVTDYFTRRFFTEYIKEEWPSLTDVLMKKDWYIFYLKWSKPHQFITSDFPLYATNPNWSNWLINPDTLLLLPISPTILLANYQITFWWSVTFAPINNRNFTKDVNHMIASNAIHMLFWKNKDLVSRMGKYRNSDSKKYEKWMTSWIDFPIDWLKEWIKELLIEEWKILV